MPTSILNSLHQLQASDGIALEILTDQSDATFQDYAKRWTDIGRKIPAAIIAPTNEEEIQKTVQWAVQELVPFVIKSGGHSEWSTIDDNGIIIDLSRYTGIKVDSEAQTATLRGSISLKEVAVALADDGLFTALENGNPIESIAYFLGGGVAVTTSIAGYGSDQIISARMIDAKGNIVEVTEEKEPDLLFALRGAGQFFGLVTELVIKAHPFAALGNDQGAIWLGRFVFPLERADEVTETMKVLMDDDRCATAGLLMIMAPPPQRHPVLLDSARFTGNLDDAKAAYGPLYNLQPLAARGGPVPLQNVSDGREAYNAHGTFKRFGVVGLRRDKEAFSKSRLAKKPGFESANSLHDIRYWQDNFIRHTDPASRGKADKLNGKSFEIMRGPDRSEYAEFHNASRTGPIELRFRGNGKLEKLKQLKKKWDPTGVLTTQLLD